MIKPPDIVRRLRGCSVSFTDETLTTELTDLFGDAADEIERLRHRNAGWENQTLPAKIVISATAFSIGVVMVCSAVAFGFWVLDGVLP